MRVSLKTGNRKVYVPDDLAGSAVLLAPNIPDNEYSPEQIVSLFETSLDSPVSGAPLHERIVGGGSTCIVVSDKTRRYGVELWLEKLIDYCNSCGVPDEKIKILFGGGAHGPQTTEERETIVGPGVAGRVPLVDHDCDDADSIAQIGTTSSGTPVEVNKIALEAYNLILTGVVMPHYYAGFTGGRKSILPGISSRRSIFANHGLNLAHGGGTHHGAVTMNLDGNPIHEDMVEAVGFVDVTFSINVINGKSGKAAAFFSGDVVGAHRAACDAAREWMGTGITEKRDWVIASCGGYPKDISFYQSHKALDNAYRTVKPGGTIILFAECSEGLGPAGFDKWFEMKDRNDIELKLREKYVVMGHTALRTLEKTQSARVMLVSGLPGETVKLTGCIPSADIEEAAAHIIAIGGSGYIMPDAGATVPVLAHDGE